MGLCILCEMQAPGDPDLPLSLALAHTPQDSISLARSVSPPLLCFVEWGGVRVKGDVRRHHIMSV